MDPVPFRGSKDLAGAADLYRECVPSLGRLGGDLKGLRKSVVTFGGFGIPALGALRFVDHAEWYVHAGDLVGRALKMPELVIEEYVGLEHAQHLRFFDAAEEERVVHAHAPGFECLYDSLMRRGISGRDDRDVHPSVVAGRGVYKSFLDVLDAVDAAEELRQCPLGQWLFEMLGLVSMKGWQAIGLHHTL